jgi:hypothetical protein
MIAANTRITPCCRLRSSAPGSTGSDELPAREAHRNSPRRSARSGRRAPLPRRPALRLIRCNPAKRAAPTHVAPATDDPARPPARECTPAFVRESGRPHVRAACSPGSSQAGVRKPLPGDARSLGNAAALLRTARVWARAAWSLVAGDGLRGSATRPRRWWRRAAGRRSSGHAFPPVPGGPGSGAGWGGRAVPVMMLIRSWASSTRTAVSSASTGSSRPRPRRRAAAWTNAC